MTDCIRRHAEFSECRDYRYTLERYWDNNLPRVLFGLLNPSTADATKDDPTNRRGMDYARRWGFGSCVFVNLFAWRSPHPKIMRKQEKPIGEDNDRHILAQAWMADLIVLGWGNDGEHRGRDKEVLELLAGFDLHYLKLTDPGNPWHPLYLKKTLVPLRWSDRLVGV